MSGDDNRKPMANITPFGLRMQPDLKARVEQAARNNNRSLNAEIVARIEAYDAIYERLMELLVEREDLKRDLAAANASLDEQKLVSRSLQALLHEQFADAREDEDSRRDADEAITRKYNDLVEQRSLLEGLKEELQHLSHARGDTSSETAALLKQQEELIAQLKEQNRLTNDILEAFRDEFFAAEADSNGDDIAARFRWRLVKQKQ